MICGFLISQLIEAERSLRDSKAKLAQLRGVPLKTLRNVNGDEPFRKDYVSPSHSKTLKPRDSSDHPRSSSSISKAKTFVVKQKSDSSNISKASGDRDRGTKRKFGN